MRILLLDIETAPHVVLTFGLHEEHIHHDNIVEPGYTLCIAYKWLGERKKHWLRTSNGDKGHAAFIRSVHALLNEADVVVTYNGRKFDVPILNKEFIEHHLGPPRPYAQVDVYQVVKRVAGQGFASKSLDYVSKTLDIGAKLRHRGISLWYGCMKDDPDQWRIMERYNKHDVTLLEGAYLELRAWDAYHPNMSIGRGHVCTKCRSARTKLDGKKTLSAGTFQQYKCLDCGAWSRGTQRIERPDRMSLRSL